MPVRSSGSPERAAAKDFCYWESPLIELDGLTMGVVGFGRIGRAVARLARAFGMEVVFSARTLPATIPAGTTPLPLDELLRRSDVVSLHVPLTGETARMINAERLALMKPTAFLVNTARGALIDEQALAGALNSKAIAGAGLDVLAEEPAGPDHPLLHARNCFVTPHIAWATRAARARLLDIAIGNIVAFLQGAPQNVVNA